MRLTTSQPFNKETFKAAFETRNAKEFLDLMFPVEWEAIKARIIETGVTMSQENTDWAPRISPVSPTMRYGKEEHISHVKSCIFRTHDFIHQLWGLPLPSAEFTEDDFYVYKRANMCGEVAVLTLTEFVFVPFIYDNYPEVQKFLKTRNAIPMLEGPLSGLSTERIAARLDGLLHKKIRPKWVREHQASMDFCDDYVPMLEKDRQLVNHNWKIMKETGFRAEGAPNARYSLDSDGLELTQWMITDFFHQMDTGKDIDKSLAEFNRQRRSTIEFPCGWNESC